MTRTPLTGAARWPPASCGFLVMSSKSRRKRGGLDWEEHGVDCDPVSSRVLVLNLRLAGDAMCVPLSLAAGPEPLWLTLRSLNGAFRAEAPDIYVCENPSVLIAAADVLGPRARPLICTSGRPSAAAVRLVTGLAANAALRYTSGPTMTLQARKSSGACALSSRARDYGATISGHRLRPDTRNRTSTHCYSTWMGTALRPRPVGSARAGIHYAMVYLLECQEL